MTPALILTHGHLGEMLMDAVEKVLGPQSDVMVLSTMTVRSISSSITWNRAWVTRLVCCL